jgi:phosphatidylglycerophosphatase A
VEKENSMKRKNVFHLFIATGFGSGYCPVAPGTAGAVLATGLWFGLSLLLPSHYLAIATAFLIVLFTILGVWSSGVMEIHWGKDPSKVVVDEMVGVWIPLLAVNNENKYYIYYALLALFLFRLFDILKPLGIRKMEALKGGWGIMFDDIVAGLYSLLILCGIQWFIG